MATLKELCSNIPQSILRTQTNYEVATRMQASYNNRMEHLDMERAIFAQCKRERTKKRVRNSFSTDEAGTCGSGTYVRRNVRTVEIREPRGKKNGVMQYRTYSVKSYSSQTCKGTF